MLKGLFKLSWIETKIFLREPMGVVGTLFMPVVFFLITLLFAIFQLGVIRRQGGLL